MEWRACLSAATVVAIVSVVASGCGGGSGSPSSSSAVKAACDAYFAAVEEACSLIAPPQLSAEQTAWEQVCG